MADVFGESVSGGDVERAVEQTLQYWIEDYLQEFELRTGRVRGTGVARPKSWRTVNEFDDKNPEDQTPFIAIISDGLARPPEQEGDGTYRATWNVGIGVIVEAATMKDAHDIVVDVYLPAIRLIMLQRQSLREWPDGPVFSSGITWIDEGYDDIGGAELNRMLFQGIEGFEVEVSGVANRFSGPMAPADPATQPGSDLPIAQTGSVVVERRQ